MGGGAPSVITGGTLVMQRWPVRSWDWKVMNYLPMVLYPLKGEY